MSNGDFSISPCLTQSFGSALNIVASSPDTNDEVVRKYKGKAKVSNLEDKKKGAKLEEVNVMRNTK